MKDGAGWNSSSKHAGVVRSKIPHVEFGLKNVASFLPGRLAIRIAGRSNMAVKVVEKCFEHTQVIMNWISHNSLNRVNGSACMITDIS